MCTRLQLPKLSPKKLQSAVHYQLAPQLLGEDTHWFHHCVQEAEVTTVLTLSQSEHKALQNKCQKLHYSACYPDYLLIPSHRDEITCVLSGERVCVRLDHTLGFTCTLADFARLLSQVWPDMKQTCKVVVSDESLLVALIESDVFARDQIVVESSCNTFCLSNAPAALNLSSYRPRHANSALLHNASKGVVMALLAAVGFHLLTQTIRYVHYSRATKQLQASIKHDYFTLFPHASALVAPRARVSTLLSGSNVSGPNQSFVRALNVLAQDFPSDHVHLRSLQYNNTGLSATITASDEPRLTKWLDKLKRQGVATVRQLQQKASGSVVVLHFPNGAKT